MVTLHLLFAVARLRNYTMPTVHSQRIADAAEGAMTVFLRALFDPDGDTSDNTACDRVR